MFMILDTVFRDAVLGTNVGAETDLICKNNKCKPNQLEVKLIILNLK